MPDHPLREPDQIRQDCARKLRSVEFSGMFAAILACLLGEDWTNPKIEELRDHTHERRSPFICPNLFFNASPFGGW